MIKVLTGVSILALTIAIAAPQVHAEGYQKSVTRKNSRGPGIAVVPAKETVEKTDKIAKSDKTAKGPALEISGSSAFNAYVFAQTKRNDPVGHGRGNHFAVDDSRINFEVVGVTGPEFGGLEYSFLVGITGNTDNQKSVEENRLKFKHRFGTLILGIHRGVTDFMPVGAFTFHKGTGNVFGNYDNIALFTTGTAYKDDPVGHGKDQTKISYVTPRFYCVQAGYSYTPDSGHSGEAKLASKTAFTGTSTGPSVKTHHIHEFGLNFKKSFENGFGLKLSATALMARAKSVKHVVPAAGVVVGYFNNGFNDAAVYALGFVMTYNGFSFGGEWLDNGRSLESGLLTGNDAGKLWNVGLGYERGRHGISIGYLGSTRKLGQSRLFTAGVRDYGTTTAKVGSISYDYKPAKGLKMYVEGNLFNFKTTDPTKATNWLRDTLESGVGTKESVGGNRGHSVIFGSAISF